MERADGTQTTAGSSRLDAPPDPSAQPQHEQQPPQAQNEATTNAAEENQASLLREHQHNNQHSITLEASPDLDSRQQQHKPNEALTIPEKEKESQPSHNQHEETMCAPSYKPQHCNAKNAESEAPVALEPRPSLEEEPHPQQQAQESHSESNQIEPTTEPAAVLRQRKSSEVAKALLYRPLDDGQDDWMPLRRPPSIPKRKRIKSWASEGEVHRILHQSFSTDYETDDDMTDAEDDDDSAFFSQAPTPRRRTSSVVTAAALALKHGKALGHSNSSPRYQLNRSGVELDESKLPLLPKRSSQQQSQQQPPPKYVNPYLIPVQHPLKSLWDILTVLLSIYNAYLTHKALKSRQFSNSGWIEAWFVADILLNFVTQRHTADGTLLTSFTSVWARYLTSWFVIDVLALFPGESLYVAPIVELQRKRKFWNKVARRTKLSVKITTRILQSGYVSWLYKLFIKARGVREITRVIKQIVYWVRWVVRYFSFMKHMKGLLAVRLLRDWGHLRRWTRKNNKDDDHSTVDLTSDEGGAAPHQNQRAGPSWEYVEEEEDPTPF